MIEIPKILGFAFINICKALLKDLKSRYKEKEWISILVRHAEADLEEASGKTLLPETKSQTKSKNTGNSAQRKGASDKEMYALICDLKDCFEPADFLTFKAISSDDERDRLFLLQQAQMISPENLNLHILVSFFSMEGLPDSASVEHLRSLTENSKDPLVREYTLLSHAIASIADENFAIKSKELLVLLNEASIPVYAKYTLLYYLCEKIPLAEMDIILKHLQIRFKKNHWMYKLLQGNVSYLQKQYKEALSWYGGIDIESVLVDRFLAVEIQYKQAICMKHTGNKGKAILLLREIIFSDLYENTYADYYFQSIVNLASYYVSIKQNHEATKVLAKMEPDLSDYIEELIGEEYLLLMAEKSLLDCDMQSALEYYKKAFKINASREIAEKIRKMESRGGDIQKHPSTPHSQRKGKGDD